MKNMNTITSGFQAAQDGLAYLNYFNTYPDSLRPAYRIWEPWKGEQIPQQWLHFRVYYTWEQYIALARGLAEKIKASWEQYNRVIWLSKWGCFIAELVAHELSLPLWFIWLQSYSWSNQKDLIETFQTIPENTTTWKTLVIDDMRDSAKSLRHVREGYQNLLWEFDIATLLNKDRPDAKDVNVKYTMFEDHPNVWVVQPGEGDFEQPTAGHNVSIGTVWPYKNLTSEAQALAQQVKKHTSIIAYSDWTNPQENSALPMWVALARITGKPFFAITSATRHLVGLLLTLKGCWDNPYVHSNDPGFSI